MFLAALRMRSTDTRFEVKQGVPVPKRPAGYGAFYMWAQSFMD